jgi:hypothetical protein
LNEEMTDEQYLECSQKVLEFIADDNPYNLEELKELFRKETPGFNLLLSQRIYFSQGIWR